MDCSQTASLSIGPAAANGMPIRLIDDDWSEVRSRDIDHVRCTCPDGYGSTDVIYWWTHAPETERSIKMASDMTLSQFDLVRFPHGNGTQYQPHRGRSYVPILSL
jgi:hypothetical protein